jgi:hypothetical protein
VNLAAAAGAGRFLAGHAETPGQALGRRQGRLSLAAIGAFGGEHQQLAEPLFLGGGEAFGHNPSV